MTTLRRCHVIVLLGLCCLPVWPVAAGGSAEYRLKAAFVYRFPQFVDWPSSAWEGASRVQLCVSTPNPFDGELEQLVRGESLQGRPLAVRHIGRPEQVAGCHVLFLAAGSDRQFDMLTAATRRPVLTVGEGERFLDAGGIIALKVVDRRVRFEISAANAQRAGLRISSQLMRLALAVKGGPS